MRSYFNTRYEIKIERDKRRYIVNPAYCLKHGISKNSAKNIAKKQMLYEDLGQFYDFNLSVIDNISNLRENGIFVGKSTLYKFIKEFSFTA